MSISAKMPGARVASKYLFNVARRRMRVYCKGFGTFRLVPTLFRVYLDVETEMPQVLSAL
jgi:hypothetical protein